MRKTSPDEIVRNQQRLKIKPEMIQEMQKADLLILQEHLGLGSEWGVMRYPKEWLTNNLSVTSAGTIYLFSTTVKNAQSDEELDLARTTLTRLVLLLFLVAPQKRGHGNVGLLSARTIYNISSHWERLIRAALLQQIEKQGQLLSRVTHDCLTVINEYRSKQASEALYREINRLHYFAGRNLWNDLPNLEKKLAYEPPRKGNTSKSATIMPPRPHLPFPDKFVSEAGWRVAWLTQHVAQPLIDAAQGFTEGVIDAESRCRDEPKRRERIWKAEKLYMAERTWHTSDGAPILRLPFEMDYNLGREGAFVWPPASRAALFAALMMVQAAHMYILLLSSGGRISEVMSLKTDCLVESADGTKLVNGRTYKLVFANEGAVRDWPMPDLAIEALHHQIRLSKVISSHEGGRGSKSKAQPISHIPLWRNFGSMLGKPLSVSYNYQLRLLITALGLDHLLGDHIMSSHRFRKTIARLVALALADAPKVLMDMFGHKSIGMTMGYILADPLIRAEIEEVRREMVIMFAEKAIENADTNGGPAAAPLRAAVKEIQIRRGKDWGKDDIRALAFTLTANGDHWALVRPGVLCTKQANQSGPCNRQQSKPDPSRCRTHCSHRLEDAAVRDDANGAIEMAIRFVADAMKEDDEIAAEMWKGQILTHIKRFDDVRDKWKDHPIVASLLQDASNEAV